MNDWCIEYVTSHFLSCWKYSPTHGIWYIVKHLLFYYITCLDTWSVISKDTSRSCCFGVIWGGGWYLIGAKKDFSSAELSSYCLIWTFKLFYTCILWLSYYYILFENFLLHIYVILTEIWCFFTYTLTFGEGGVWTLLDSNCTPF